MRGGKAEAVRRNGRRAARWESCIVGVRRWCGSCMEGMWLDRSTCDWVSKGVGRRRGNLCFSEASRRIFEAKGIRADDVRTGEREERDEE